MYVCMCVCVLVYVGTCAIFVLQEVSSPMAARTLSLESFSASSSSSLCSAKDLTSHLY